ncbi:hypothetical protein D3C84_817130 [compost metagenome]
MQPRGNTQVVMFEGAFQSFAQHWQSTGKAFEPQFGMGKRHFRGMPGFSAATQLGRAVSV